MQLASSKSELCLQSRKDRQRGREMDGWIKIQADTLLHVCVQLSSHSMQLFAVAKNVFGEIL